MASWACSGLQAARDRQGRCRGRRPSLSPDPPAPRPVPAAGPKPEPTDRPQGCRPSAPPSCLLLGPGHADGQLTSCPWRDRAQDRLANPPCRYLSLLSAEVGAVPADRGHSASASGRPETEGHSQPRRPSLTGSFTHAHPRSPPLYPGTMQSSTDSGTSWTGLYPLPEDEPAGLQGSLTQSRQSALGMRIYSPWGDGVRRV